MKKIWSSAKADKEFSKWIRERDVRCFFCPNEGKQASHFWGRNISATRYHPGNVDSICGGCHMRHEGNKQGLYRELKIKQLGQKEYDELKKMAYQSKMTRREAIIKLMGLLTPLK